MTRISVDYYNFHKRQYPQVVDALKKHLSVKSETDKDWRREVLQEELEKVINRIPGKPEPYQPIQFELAWNPLAKQFAYYKGLSNTNLNLDQNIESEEMSRYDLPRSFGTTQVHKFDIFGNGVNSSGDHPFQIQMNGDINNDIDDLRLLEHWYEVFKSDEQTFLDKVINVGKKMQGSSEQGDMFLASLPRNIEGFKSRIGKAKKHIDLDMAQCAIQMGRFYHDFIGIPVEEVLGKPNSLEFTGLHNFKLSISPHAMEVISEQPTKPLEEVAERIFPKQRDDLRLSGE